MATTSHDGDYPQSRGEIFIPVARARALTHALIWLVPAFVVLTFSWTIVFGQATARPWDSLNIVNVAMLLVIVPIDVLALGFAAWGARWMLLALWPGRTGIAARPDELVLALGSFGTRRFPIDQLDVRYFFELEDEGGEEGFEAFLPEEEQINSFLPRIKHRRSHEPIHRVIQRFVAGTEADVAQALRPMVATWRREDEREGPDE